MTFQNVLLISSGDRRLAKRLEQSMPNYELVGDYNVFIPNDAYGLKTQSMHNLAGLYPMRKPMLYQIFPKVAELDSVGDIAINRAYTRLELQPKTFFHTFFKSFGYTPKIEKIQPNTLTRQVAIVEYETANMHPNMMHIAEAIHLSSIDTQVWHFYTSPYPQGFGFYNTFDKQMYVIDGSKLLQQLWYEHDPEHTESKIYNPMLVQVFDQLFDLSSEMCQNEIQKDRVATHKPGNSQFSIYNNQNTKDSK